MKTPPKFTVNVRIVGVILLKNLTPDPGFYSLSWNPITTSTGKIELTSSSTGPMVISLR